MLSKDIKRTMVVKGVLLFVLWFVCFHGQKPEINVNDHFYAKHHYALIDNESKVAGILNDHGDSA